MRHFCTVLLALAAHAVHVALGHGRIEERDMSMSSMDVEISHIRPFEPWPGFFEGKTYFESRSLQKRSRESQNVCARLAAGLPVERQPLGFPKQSKAWCEKDDPIKKKFWVVCAQEGRGALGTHIWRAIEGKCEGDTMCIDFRHSLNEFGQRSQDVDCVSRDDIRQWAIDASRAQQAEICSPSYVNNVKGKQKVKMALQVGSPPLTLTTSRIVRKLTA